ncbi:MAG: hypothetical protein SPE66_03800 [Bilifractor sp.]|nr:hypothetical protein [Bilifractor sp.]
MAGSRIKEITIEIDGDTTKHTTALKKVDKQIRDTQSSLQDVNKLLKMDPGNADLLAQKQNILFAFSFIIRKIIFCGVSSDTEKMILQRYTCIRRQQNASRWHCF